MNVFQLVIKNMRQRSLSTWLTLLSVMLGAGLAICTMIMARESGQLFGQSSYGYDIIVGKKGSPLQLVLNTVYQIDQSQGNIPYSIYEEMKTKYRPEARIATPICVGDSYQGKYRIVGTSANMFGYDDATMAPLPQERVMPYRQVGSQFEYYQFAEGSCFNSDKFEGVIGSEVAKQTGLKIGDTFQATHGLAAPQPGQAPHREVWKVVGVLQPTHTASDRVLFIPYKTTYTIEEHSAGLIAQYALAHNLSISSIKDMPTGPTWTLNPDGTIDLKIPKEYWEVSAILVQTRGGVTFQNLTYMLNNGSDVMAVNPALTMKDFFDTFLSPLKEVELMNYSLVTIVAAVAILVSIYNSVSARMREIAILRALGATRGKILSIICLEAGAVALFGGLLGLIVAHATSFGCARYIAAEFGEQLNWLRVSPDEIVYVLCVVAVAMIAGLVPALKAYRVPVATNLVAA